MLLLLSHILYTSLAYVQKKARKTKAITLARPLCKKGFNSMRLPTVTVRFSSKWSSKKVKKDLLEQQKWQQHPHF